MQGYDPFLGIKAYCTIRGALVYDYPYTGWTYHIVIHQAVEIPDLKHHMLFPMQVCTNGVTVNDCTRFLTDHPTEGTHAIIVATRLILGLIGGAYLQPTATRR